MDGHQNSWDEYQRVLFMLERHTNGGDISIYSGIPEIDGTEILFPPNTKFIVQKKDIIEIPFDDNTKKAIHRIMIIQKKHS